MIYVYTPGAGRKLTRMIRVDGIENDPCAESKILLDMVGCVVELRARPVCVDREHSEVPGQPNCRPPPTWSARGFA